jgi:hypothetical protein
MLAEAVEIVVEGVKVFEVFEGPFSFRRNV